MLTLTTVYMFVQYERQLKRAENFLPVLYKCGSALGFVHSLHTTQL